MGGFTLKKTRISKILCLSLCASMVCPYMTASAQTQYGTVELINNGGFEAADAEDFPAGWSSNGKNLLLGGDFETGDAALTSVGTAATGETLRWASPTTGTNDISIVRASEEEKSEHGDYYARMRFTAQNWGGLGYPNLSKTSNLLNVAYGGEYLFKADYKVSSTDAFNAATMSAYYMVTTAQSAEKNTTMFEPVFPNKSSMPSTQWQEFSTSFTVIDRPEGENLQYDPPCVSRFQFRYGGKPVIGAGESADLFADNIRLEKLGRTSSEYSASGSRSLKIVGYADTEDEIWESGQAEVEPGEEIDVSAKVLSETVAKYTANGVEYEGKIKISAVFDDGSEAEIGSITQSGNDYVTVSDAVTVPQYASRMNIRITFTGEGIAYIDDVSATAQREIADIAVPEDYKNIIANGGFENYDSHDFPVGFSSAGKNLIANGDFETNSLECGKDLSGTRTLTWAKAGYVSAVTLEQNCQSDLAAYGNYAMKMQWGDTKWGGAVLQHDANGIFRLSYGNSYILRASIKSATENDFISNAQRFQFNVNVGGTDNIVDESTWVPSTQWQEYSAVFSAPQNAGFAGRLQLRGRTANTAGSVLYADNISVEKTSRTDSAEKNTGDRSLRIDGYADSDGADEVWTSETVGINGGEDVYFGLSYKKDSITAGAGARLVFVGASERILGTETVDLGTGSKSIWQQRIVKAIAPEDAECVYVEIYLKEGSGTLWTDDVFVSVRAEEEHENVIVPDQIINIVGNSGFEDVDGRLFPTGWTSDGQNLIKNGDFEDEAYWYAAGASASGTREFAYSSDSPDGTTSGNLKWTEATGNEEWGCMAYREGQGTPAAASIPVALDSDYYVAMDAKLGDNIKGNNIRVMAEMKNGDNQWAAQTLLSKTADGEWANYTSTYHTPLASAEKNGNNPDVSGAYIYYVYAGRATAIPIESGETQLWIDNLRLEKVGRADTAEYAAGERSLKIVGYTDGVDEVWESDDVLGVTAGETVYYGGKVKLQGLKDYARFAVNFYDKNGVFISSDGFSAGRGTKAWESYTDAVTAPQGADYAKLALIVNDGKGTAWFDDVVLGKQISGIYAKKAVFDLDELASNAGKTLTASTNVYSYEDAADVMLALAVYNQGMLVGIDVKSARADGEGVPVSASVTIPDIGETELASCIAKAFIWDSDTYKPIHPVCVLAGSKTIGGITMSPAYGDNMVFQQGEEITVSGTAMPGETVDVSFGNRKQTASADEDGNWSVDFSAMAAGGPYALVAEDGRGHKEVFTNIMIGEVWLVSGQSNMQYTTSAFKELDQYTEDNEMLRLFSVPRVQEDEPVDTLAAGEWKKCTKSVASSFSAVGYLIGRELSKAMPDVAIGIVESSYAGSDIGEWMDNQTAYLANVNTAAEKRSKRFNGMIYPLREFKYKGVAWYQGESSRNWLYQIWLEAMVSNWRSTFNQPKLDFAVVGLPRFNQDQFVIVRECQRLAAEEDDNIHLSVNIDLGEKDNVHPSDKLPLVQRLSNVILKEVYGRNIDCYGPKFKSVSFEGNKAIVTFDNAQGITTTDGNAPREFIIAGSDGNFVVADAVINNGKIELTAPGVSKPVYVRYAFEGYPEPNLIGGNGLPAEPFRTDSIKDVYPFEG